MKTISVLSQKGGAGKTTIACNLAVAAEQAGQQTIILDTDPQSSAAAWKDNREQETPAVIAIPPARLPQAMKAAEKAGATLVIIDTSPRAESPALSAARASDIVLIPCRPAAYDILAIRQTIDIVQLADRLAVVVLNAVPSRGTLVIDAEQAIEKYGIGIAPVHLGHRSVYVYSAVAGLAVQEYEPSGKAAQEIGKLYTWIWRKIHSKVH